MRIYRPVLAAKDLQLKQDLDTAASVGALDARQHLVGWFISVIPHPDSKPAFLRRKAVKSLCFQRR